MSDIFLTPNIPQYWENLYANGDDAWNLNKETPALLEFLDSPLCPKSGDVLVPLAGKGYDALAWAKRGFNVLAVDFCPTAVDALGMMHNKENLKILNIDAFMLSPRFEDRGGKKFDIIYDYCGYTGINPGRRDEYAEMWTRMLKDDGLIIGFFYPLCNEKARQLPPFIVTEAELLARFSGVFNIQERIKPAKSVKERIGKEEIWLLRKPL